MREIVRGWKAITAITNMSKKTIKKLIDDDDNPFPIALLNGQWVMSEDIYVKYINAIIEKQLTKRKKVAIDQYRFKAGGRIST